MLPSLAFAILVSGPFDAFKPGERAILAAPDKVILRRLDRNSPNPVQLRVLESKTFTTKRGIDGSLAALKKGLTGPATMAKCFNPRHRIILFKGSQKLSVLICFECHQYTVEDPVGQRPYLPFSNQAEPLIKRLLKG